MRFPSAMMKMPCQHQARNQAPEVGKDLFHLKLQPEEEEGAGVGAEARIPAP